MNLFWVLFVSFVGRGYGLCDFTDQEPCLFKNNRELPYPVYTRHPSIGYSSLTDATKFCDLFALNHGQWYRSSYNMTNYCVDHRKCGTSDPIYLNGSIPSPADGVVDATACVRTFENCCEHKLNLRIKHCEYFMVYCFLDLHPSCHSRFCLDVDLDFETTTTTSTTTTTTTTTTPSKPVPTQRPPVFPPHDKHDGIYYKSENKVQVMVHAAFNGIFLVMLVILAVFIYRQRSQKVAAESQVTHGLKTDVSRCIQLPTIGYEKTSIPPYENNVPPNEQNIPI